MKNDPLNNLDSIVQKVKQTSTVNTPVQKVVPINNSSDLEISYHLKMPKDLLLFLKNKASYVHGLTVKELINTALLSIYEDDFNKYLKENAKRK